MAGERYEATPENWLEVIAACAADGGGEVHLAAGEYRCPVDWQLPRNVAIHGHKTGPTRIEGGQ